MLVYKALYRKMMDDLKDAGMWIDWSEQLEHDHPEVAKMLRASAMERLEDDFPQTHQMFCGLCEKDEEHKGKCMNGMVEEHMMDWYESMLNRLKRMK